MSRNSWWLLHRLSLLLEPAEREAVLGDIAESNEPVWRALGDLLGLAARRQVALGKDWRQWLALAAVAPAALLLSRASEWLASAYGLSSWILWNYKDLDQAVLAENHLSLGNELVQALRASLVLTAWSWSSGFALGSLSRRARWLSEGLFCALFLYGPALRALRELSVSVATCATIGMVFVTLFLGMALGRKRDMSPAVRTMLWIGAIVTALGARSSFWWPDTSRYGLLLVVAYWPLAYLAAGTVWTRWNRAAV